VDNIKIDLGEIEWDVWAGSIWFRMGAVDGSCEHGNEPSGSIKWEILKQLHIWRLLKKVSSPWSIWRNSLSLWPQM
jgi:hypothetical protein